MAQAGECSLEFRAGEEHFHGRQAEKAAGLVLFHASGEQLELLGEVREGLLVGEVEALRPVDQQVEHALEAEIFPLVKIIFARR